MKRFFISLLAAACLSFPAAAGIFSPGDGDILFDVRAGINASNLYLSGPAARGLLGNRTVGFNVSGNVSFQLAEGFFVVTGLGVESKGSRSSKNPMHGVHVDYFPIYATLPLGVSFRPQYTYSTSGFFDIGIYAGYGIGGKWKEPSGLSFPYFGTAVENIAQRWDGGVRLGIGAFFSERFLAGVYYQQSVFNVANADTTSQYGKLYNNTISLQVGVIF